MFSFTIVTVFIWLLDLCLVLCIISLSNLIIEKDGKKVRNDHNYSKLYLEGKIGYDPYIDYSISGNTLKIRVLVNDFATIGKVRIKFSNARKTSSAYLDFDIASAF